MKIIKSKTTEKKKWFQGQIICKLKKRKGSMLIFGLKNSNNFGWKKEEKTCDPFNQKKKEKDMRSPILKKLSATTLWAFERVYCS